MRLLLDYLTNFKNIDNLLMLEAYGVSPRGEKNIQVRLFGKPSSKIISDSVFLTTNCETGFDGCIERKTEMGRASRDRKWHRLFKPTFLGWPYGQKRQCTQGFCG